MEDDRLITPGSPAPFDHARLDALLGAAGVDLLIATSPHNVRYLLGGYENYFFGSDPALAMSRYQPVVGYRVGRPESAFFVGNGLDRDHLERTPIWIDRRLLDTVDTVAVASVLADQVRQLGLERSVLGVELPFLPADTWEALRHALPEVRLVDATATLDELRTLKDRREVDLMRDGSERVVDAMLAVFDQLEVGMTSTDLVDRLAFEERARGLQFGYCHVAIGNDFNRAPSDRRIEPGVPICLDSGGYLEGYIADLARMACIGEPSPELRRALGVVDAIQQAALEQARPGARAGTIYEAAEREIERSGLADRLDFLPHGLGLVNHEGPRIVPVRGNPHSYPPDHVERPLEPGMVLSLESFLRDPVLGFVKLEDTLVVTDTGCELFADRGRDWTVIG